MNTLERTDFASLYRFLALAFQPPDEALIELCQDVNVLRPYLQNLAALKEDHTWLFEFNVYPYASIFLDSSAMLQSDWSHFVAGLYSHLGLELSSETYQAADQLSTLFEAMALLSERRTQAHAEGLESLSYQRSLHVERAFCFEHLLPWLPSFCHAVCRIHKSFYKGLCQFAQEITLTHAKDIIQLAHSLPDYEAPPQKIQLQATNSQPNSQDANTEIQKLLSPALSGMFLSREDLRLIARGLSLPYRFAERSFILKNLIEAAHNGDKLGKLFEALRVEAQRQALYLEECQQSLGSLSLWQGQIGKLRQTASRLAWLSREA